MNKLNKQQIIKTLKKINFSLPFEGGRLGYEQGEFRVFCNQGHYVLDYKVVKPLLLKNECFLLYVE